MTRATYFIYQICLITIACLLTSCDVKREEPFDGDPAFRTAIPDQLYFANIRSNLYYRERPKGTELDLYRLKQISQAASRPMLVPIIVQAYLKDEAYLFVRQNDYAKWPASVVVSVVGAGSDTTQLDVRSGSKADQVSFARDLRAAITRGDSLSFRDATGEFVC